MLIQKIVAILSFFTFTLMSALPFVGGIRLLNDGVSAVLADWVGVMLIIIGLTFFSLSLYNFYREMQKLNRQGPFPFG